MHDQLQLDGSEAGERRHSIRLHDIAAATQKSGCRRAVTLWQRTHKNRIQRQLGLNEKQQKRKGKKNEERRRISTVQKAE
jgi:hypothetical protein